MSFFDVFMIVLLISMSGAIALAIILIIYSILNCFLCTSKLDYDELPSFYRIIRNGNNTISLERKELFGCWNTRELSYKHRSVYSVPDTQENMDYLKEQITDEREAIKDRIKKKEDNMTDLEKHKKKPKIAHTDP